MSPCCLRGPGAGARQQKVHLAPPGPFEVLWIDLLAPDIERRLAARPERLRELITGAPDAPVVVVDEVHRVPGVPAQTKTQRN